MKVNEAKGDKETLWMITAKKGTILLFSYDHTEKVSVDSSDRQNINFKENISIATQS